MATSCQLDKIVQAGWPEPAAARAAGHAALARPQPPATRTCKREGCDTQFVPRSNAARYCSKACRDIAAARTRRARYQTRRGGSKVYAPATLRCEKCGEIFEPATSEKTCSPRCRAAQQRIARRGGPIRRCVVCGVDYRERDGHRGCCSVKCSEAADADMDWDLLGRGCLLAVLVLLADESRAGGHATSGSVAARLGVSRSNALKHLGTLERCGLAERVHACRRVHRRHRARVQVDGRSRCGAPRRPRSDPPTRCRPSSRHGKLRRNWGQTCGCWRRCGGFCRQAPAWSAVPTWPRRPAGTPARCRGRWTASSQRD